MYNGALVLEQPRKGYRFSVDAPLLAAFASARFSKRVIDLGAGCGVVGLGIMHLKACRHLTMVEIQPALAALAESNAARNGFSGVCTTLNMDLRKLKPESGHGEYDLVVVNPPYQPVGEGRPPEDEERRIARTREKLSMSELAAAVNRIMKPKGTAAIIHAAGRMDELIIALGEQKLHPSRMCLCHPKQGESAELVLIEAARGKGGHMNVQAPWILHDAGGEDSPLLKAILTGRIHHHPCA